MAPQCPVIKVGATNGRAPRHAPASSPPATTCARPWQSGFVRLPRQAVRVAVLDPWARSSSSGMTTRRSAFIGRCLEAAWARGRRFFKPLAENSSRRPAGTISNPALNYGPGGTTSRTTGNPCTSSSESSWGTGHAVTRRVTFPQLTLRTESCDGNGGHLLSWRTVGRRCGRHNFPSCSGGCCTKVLRPHQQVSITADNVRAPRTHGRFIAPGIG
jgi:hypothetical protein